MSLGRGIITDASYHTAINSYIIDLIIMIHVENRHNAGIRYVS